MRAQLQSTEVSERSFAAQKLGCFGSHATSAADALGVALHDEHEPVAINSSYALGAIGKLGISILQEAVKHGDGPNESDPRLFFDEGQEWNLGYSVRNAAHGLIAAGNFSAPVLLDLLKNGDGLARRYSAFALGEIGIETDEIEKSLVHLSQDSDVFVRISATESLGLNASGKLSVDALCQILTEDLDDETRSHAALALWRMSPNTDSAISSLSAALNDGDRYVQGYALEALERIGTPEAMNVLLPSLKTSRWCSITHPQSMF